MDGYETSQDNHPRLKIINHLNFSQFCFIFGTLVSSRVEKIKIFAPPLIIKYDPKKLSTHGYMGARHPCSVMKQIRLDMKINVMRSKV